MIIATPTLSNLETLITVMSLLVSCGIAAVMVHAAVAHLLAKSYYTVTVYNGYNPRKIIVHARNSKVACIAAKKSDVKNNMYKAGLVYSA